MPEEKDTGGQVYPRQASHPPHPGDIAGITRRDWLAGLAMQGLIVGIRDNTTIEKSREDLKFLSAGAYVVADAMIAESNK